MRQTRFLSSCHRRAIRCKVADLSLMSEASHACVTDEPKATDTMTVLEGFDAMRVFLEAVWQRQGKDAADIAFVLGGSRWRTDGSVTDPTIWED
jgi:hypothetical protein